MKIPLWQRQYSTLALMILAGALMILLGAL